MKKNIILGLCLMMILSVGSVAVQAQGLGMNGVAYVLLGNEFDSHGVYRLNEYSADASVRAVPYKLFNLNSMPGKVSGLSANQQKQVFLLAGPLAGEWADAEVGWLPTGMRFDDDSPIYLKTMLPNDPEGGVTNYNRTGNPHSFGSYWQTNYTIAGKTYAYGVKFGGPTEVKYLNGVSGTIGTPVWPGTFSATTGIAHPTDPRKVILPSHWAGVAYYAYGTQSHPEFPREALDGTIGLNGNLKPTTLWSAGQAGHEIAPKYIFSCIVKRVYKKRTKSLDLYAALDNAPPPPSVSPTLQSAGMLSSIDVNVTEAYGKYCGDNCIPGGSIGQNSIMTQLSTVRVVTSTRGARYGFNPQGIRKISSVSEINAALRVVKPGSAVTEALSISTDEAGTTFAPVIVNGAYLASIGVTPANLKTLGASSDFSSVAGIDYLYGSDADKFVVQDSWWGRGGVAYEYYEDTGAIRKLDYMANTNPTIEELGVLSGKIDDIGVDGDGYLYVMRTEKLPIDDEMVAMAVNISNPAAHPQFFEVSSTWLRPPPEGGETSDPSPIPEGSQQIGDYKEVTLKQDVYKTVKRYPQGTGALGTEEDRGSVLAGFDLWTRSFEVKADGSIGWKHVTWSIEAEGDRDSTFAGELAVVNLAKVPDNLPGSDKLNVIAIGNVDDSSSTLPNQDYTTSNPALSIKEHSTMTFKVEGYKPYIDGVAHELKPMGNIVNPNTGATVLTNVRLNSTPNANGTYSHDENNDGSPSGFPSSMFESTERDTVVKWRIKLVEESDASAPSFTEIETFPEVTGAGEFRALSFNFPHPGNYLIEAVITYNHFNFSGVDNTIRPHELTFSSKTVTTAPFIVKVFSESLNLNNSPSYITNIQIKPTVRSRLHSVANSSVDGTGPVTSLLDFEEDKALGGIEITFDAQFVRDANRVTNIGSALATFDGIGVWDYRYYARLYNEIPNTFPGMTAYGAPTTVSDLTNESSSAHAYNYNALGTLLDISTKIKPDVYNPARPKGAEVGVDNGTRVDSAPTAKDWSFIQWGLYLQPTGPYNMATPTSFLDADGRHTRGILVAQGACNDAEVVTTDLGNRKYSVRVPIDSSKFSQIINTPKDPETFNLHLEILYPRVSWLSNDLGDSATDEKRFSSMVPLSNSGGDKPFHILGRMRLVPGTAPEPGSNALINQSWKDSDSGDEFFVSGKESIGVLARDFTLPRFVEAPGTNATPIIQTTGDEASEVKVSFAVYDNNPHAEIGIFYPAYEMLKVDPATDAPLRRFDSTDSNKEFKKGPPITDIAEHKGPLDTNFYSNNDWEAGASFTAILAEYGPGSRFDTGKELENWIGSLNYTVLGSIKDGIGSYSTIVEHQFYHEKACNDIGITVDDNAKIVIDNVLVKAVERVDNDPPSIEVELISQVDNRRWEFKLNEMVNDLCRLPTTVENLGQCTLAVTSYNLQTNTPITTLSFDQIPGCTAYPDDIGQTDINALTVMPAALPEFRRASRLMINVKIFDNTGFRELKEATIKVVNLDGGETSLLPTNSPQIPLMAWQNINGNAIDGVANRPRASYSVDMPMKAVTGQNQVLIEVYASDLNNNRRRLTIPIKVVESTFETRVLEIKENRN
ncbi:MAG: hypothetical protein CVV42_03070 [Candidatus Riflebacteria bacterium HGW-Riflebacteria-2]|jgi:hypothetical protein|nr:MAG: hypothetical protein CVV42_03070 [Candidatus Riflebacteria bacterium HGW-Riflebacteria-2]